MLNSSLAGDLGLGFLVSGSASARYCMYDDGHHHDIIIIKG
jgi:hypothetical protein